MFTNDFLCALGLPDGSVVQNLPAKQTWFDPWVGNLAREKEMASHCSILAWEILWLEDPGRLLSMGCKESDTTEHLIHSLSNTIPQSLLLFLVT